MHGHTNINFFTPTVIRTEDLTNTSEALRLRATFSVWERNSHDEQCSHSENTLSEYQNTEICYRCFSGTIRIRSTVTSAQFSVSRIPPTLPLFIMHHQTFVRKSNSRCYVQHFKAYIYFQRRSKLASINLRNTAKKKKLMEQQKVKLSQSSVIIFIQLQKHLQKNCSHPAIFHYCCPHQSRGNKLLPSFTELHKR